MAPFISPLALSGEKIFLFEPPKGARGAFPTAEPLMLKSLLIGALGGIVGAGAIGILFSVSLSSGILGISFVKASLQIRIYFCLHMLLH